MVIVEPATVFSFLETLQTIVNYLTTSIDGTVQVEIYTTHQYSSIRESLNWLASDNDSLSINSSHSSQAIGPFYESLCRRRDEPLDRQRSHVMVLP